jgi:hypothetical protein
MQVEGLNAKSYSTLSPAGRFKVVVLIRNSAEEAWLCGKDLLRGLECAYRELKLARYQLRFGGNRNIAHKDEGA